MKLHGRPLASGLAAGTTFIHRDVMTFPEEQYEIEPHEIEREIARLQSATAAIDKDLAVLVTRVEKEMDSKLAGIFDAHRLILDDPSLKKELDSEVRTKLVNASVAVRTVFRRWERRFRSMEAEIARQKGDDIKDLAHRLLASLAGVHSHALEKLPPGSVLVARRLLPSDTIYLGRRSAAAAILESGGPSSHAALFAREIGLPCISGIEGATDVIASGITVLVDADSGEIILQPDEAETAAFKARQATGAATRDRARKQAQSCAETRDGIAISVVANVGCPDDVHDALENGAEGIGLYRLEQIYLARKTPPLLDELVAEIRRTLEPVGRRPAHVRLLDIGADKQLPFLQNMQEINPALGRRGIRLLRHFPDLLQTQVDALLMLSRDFDIRIIVPMVTLTDDMAAVRLLVTETAARLGVAVPALGALVETPAAALSASALTPLCDFFSVGTNDLTQYCFAADRENSAVDQYFDDTHDTIFKLISMIHDSAQGKPLSVCGELASRSQCVERLLRCGVRTLSVAPGAVPAIKEAVRMATAQS